MLFHKSDLLIDCIKNELEESFPGFLEKENKKENKKEEKNYIAKLTTPYYNWVTGGKLYEENFRIDSEFIKDHENCLRKTTSSLKLVIHEFVRYTKWKGF